MRCLSAHDECQGKTLRPFGGREVGAGKCYTSKTRPHTCSIISLLPRLPFLSSEHVTHVILKKENTFRDCNGTSSKIAACVYGLGFGVYTGGGEERKRKRKRKRWRKK